MLFTSAMVTTTMAIACALSFPEAEGGEEEEAAAAAAVVEEEWDPQGQDMVLPPDAQRTELWCQVGDVIFPLRDVFISNFVDKV